MSHDKHYAGRFIAEVVSVDDPEKRCRIKVNVYDIFDGVPVRDLPWAVFSLPLGSRAGEGMLCPVRVGDMVWVEFIGGDTRRPVVVGGAHASPGGVPTLPPEIFQGAGQFEHKRTPDEPPVQTPPYYEDRELYPDCRRPDDVFFRWRGKFRQYPELLVPISQDPWGDDRRWRADI